MTRMDNAYYRRYFAQRRILGICADCGIQLTQTDSPRCSSCRARRRDYMRKGLHINGVWVKADKRPRPDHCEMCSKQVKRLHYHHWDNEDLRKGLWLCAGCHAKAEIVEQKVDEAFRLNYLALKESIVM